MADLGLALGALTGYVESRVFIRGTCDAMPTVGLEQVLTGEALFSPIRVCKLQIHTTVRDKRSMAARLCSADVSYSATETPGNPVCTVAVRKYAPFGPGENIYRDYQVLLASLQASEGQLGATGWILSTDVVINGCAGGKARVIHPSYFPLGVVYDAVMRELRSLVDQYPDLAVVIERFAGFLDVCRTPYDQIASYPK
ncbi:MAG: hypothetical protein PHY34_00725 [Patescibacteria group bacterium]|nr:hypothetical protein [Patescibacteria group bacterium]MDD5715847.1 hypothetical protein [Patescibacteria group bacterium]